MNKYQPPRGIRDYASTEASAFIDTEELLTEIAYSQGFEFVSPASIDFSYISDFNEISKERRYELSDKKGRELTLATDSALSMMRIAAAKSLVNGQYFCKQKVYRYRRKPYRAWTQFTFFYLGIDNENYILNSIFKIILKISKLFAIEEPHFAIEFHDTPRKGFVYTLNLEDIVRLLEAQKKDLKSSKLSLRELIFENFGSQFNPKFGNPSYTRFSFRAYDINDRCWLEGGNYNREINSFTDGKYNCATSFCLGLDLFSKNFPLRKKKSELLILIDQDDLYYISHKIDYIIDKCSTGYDKFSIKYVSKKERGRLISNMVIFYDEIIFIDDDSLKRGTFTTFSIKNRKGNKNIY